MCVVVLYIFRSLLHHRLDLTSLIMCTEFWYNTRCVFVGTLVIVDIPEVYIFFCVENVKTIRMGIKITSLKEFVYLMVVIFCR